MDFETGTCISVLLLKLSFLFHGDCGDSYTMDILQVAAEQEKQKSYKDLEKALKDQVQRLGLSFSLLFFYAPGTFSFQILRSYFMLFSCYFEQLLNLD